jgi:hypothetical protein
VHSTSSRRKKIIPAPTILELAYFPKENLQIALRVEHSEELAEEPQWQYGIACSWYFGNRFNIAIDYLYGDYKKNVVLDDDDDNVLKHSHTLAALISMEF